MCVDPSLVCKLSLIWNCWTSCNRNFVHYVVFLPLQNYKMYLLHTEQRSSSLPSPQPSRPEHTIAVDRHLPLAHLKGQYRLTLDEPPKYLVKDCGLVPHKCAGSSLPSLQETIALQYSYSGRHSPLRHMNVFSGHL